MLKFTSSTHYIHNVKKVSSQFKYKNIMLCDNRRTIEFENLKILLRRIIKCLKK